MKTFKNANRSARRGHLIQEQTMLGVEILRKSRNGFWVGANNTPDLNQTDLRNNKIHHRKVFLSQSA